MAVAEPVKIERVAILADILRRNALRREAQLPLLNVQALYRKEVAYRRAWALHNIYYPSLRSEAIERLTHERGVEFIKTRPGAWMAHTEAIRLMRERPFN